MPQTNLVAVIPGTNPSLAPLLVADHVDTAFDEDLALKGIYLAVPGADDNATATAALLRAAEVLRTRHPDARSGSSTSPARSSLPTTSARARS